MTFERGRFSLPTWHREQRNRAAGSRGKSAVYGIVFHRPVAALLRSADPVAASPGVVRVEVLITGDNPARRIIPRSAFASSRQETAPCP
jgi:hypothetical protein